MAYLHYPQLKNLGADDPAVQRIEACTRDKGFSSNDLLAWSSYLAGGKNTNTIQAGAATQDTSTDFTKHPMYLHQASLIDQLIQVNQKLDMRLSIMEVKFYNKQQDTPTTNEESINTKSNEPPAKRRRTSGATNLKDVWFTWYTQFPRIWSSTDAGTKYARSTAKQVVAFLKLFLPDGFKLHKKSPRYRDEVLKIGEAAEVKLLAYLRGRDITARGAQNVLKSMRKLHKSGHLNDRVRRYQKLQAANCIEDPAPAHTTKILGLASLA
ncbi:hypothetical protein PC121_g21079 [Phytophthora cactorum]|nr:hypothetical protein PC120_g15467 [Phytophthora cactorum]KAG3045735.1 hypothetical protein PC121_g21079 [Phytophthora cactorum]